MQKLLLILTIVLVCVGCKRTTFDYAGIEEPRDKPAYNVKFSSEIVDQKDKDGSVVVDPNHAVPQS